MDHDPVDDDRERPTTNQPLHGERRPLAGPLLAVLVLIALIAGIFLLVNYLRYST